MFCRNANKDWASKILAKAKPRTWPQGVKNGLKISPEMCTVLRALTNRNRSWICLLSASRLFFLSFRNGVGRVCLVTVLPVFRRLQPVNCGVKTHNISRCQGRRKRDAEGSMSNILRVEGGCGRLVWGVSWDGESRILVRDEPGRKRI